MLSRPHVGPPLRCAVEHTNRLQGSYWYGWRAVGGFGPGDAAYTLYPEMKNLTSKGDCARVRGMNLFFEVTYRGVTATVEPARGLGRWEMCVEDGRFDNNWVPVGCGDYPTVSPDAARAAALKRLREEFHPAALREADREYQRWARRIAELKSE
jgi:hypothetical protein